MKQREVQHVEEIERLSSENYRIRQGLKHQQTLEIQELLKLHEESEEILKKKVFTVFIIDIDDFDSSS